MELIQKWWALVLLLFLFASPVQADLITRVNYQRKIRGIPVLIVNPILNKAAQIKACDLKRGYWAHVNPEGVQPGDVTLSLGYNFDWYGQNLARDCNDSYCMSMWMNSASHRANILSRNYVHVGTGVCGRYKAMEFGSLQ